jgi:tRNA-specific 2-thiouridylase
VARAADRSKDQSYVLYGLGPEDLEHIRFPLGERQKSEVRALAREAGLPVADKRESQEICFVPSGDYRDLVRSRRPDAFRPGEIVDESGKTLGRHAGVGAFTVGQRKGLGLTARAPLFVKRIDAGQRRVVVAPRESLGVREVLLDEMCWTGADEPEAPRSVDVVLRYRARPRPATAHAEGRGRAILGFTDPAWPVTPGQAAVLYEGDVVLGGGRIKSCS